ncbi:MAG: PepSY domain-containing protein [Nanoarchaeota archaeon]|nr:PepSY domain-containing protein [Nanoarchaeota archaeon]
MKKSLIPIIFLLFLTGFTIADAENDTVKMISCAKAGEVAVSNPPTINKECCEGLEQISSINGFDEQCNPLEGGGSICSDCGNNICEDWENECSCSKDCLVESNCAKESETCGTIVGIYCCSGLTCEYNKKGGRTTTDESGTCITEKIKPMIKERNRLQIRVTGECPEECSCDGSAIKCEFKNRREMTIRAGKSGNMIIQTKEANASTKVELYKSNESVYGVFRGNKTKEIILPDRVKEKIKERVRARLENHEITLDEEGVYHVQAKKRARLFFLIPVKEDIASEVDAETGEVIRIRHPWWGFLARDTPDTEELVGESCGTVTPGQNDACCQTKGYEKWNSETEECE